MSFTPFSRHLWYRFFKRDYHGNDPCLFDKSRFAWTNTIEYHADEIREEMLSVALNQRELLKPYRFHKPQKHVEEWLTLPFLSWGYRNHANCRIAPATMRILESLPEVVSASLSWMAPGTHVTVHQGDTNAIVRSHLGISIPGGLPDCGFRVCDEKRPWEEGQLLPFCDAQPHEAWNFTNQERIVMIIDAIRPEYMNMKHNICSMVIATHLLHAIDKRYKFIENASPKQLERLAQLLKWVVRMGLPVQKTFGKLLAGKRVTSIGR